MVLTARCFAVAGGNLEGAFAYTQYRIDSLLVGVILSAIYWMKPGVYHQLAKRKWLLVASIVALCAWLAFATHTSRSTKASVTRFRRSVSPR